MNIFNTAKTSIHYLINQIPFDGCLLVFNAKSNSWRTEASEANMLTCRKVSKNVLGRRDPNGICDLYITWKQ